MTNRTVPSAADRRQPAAPGAPAVGEPELALHQVTKDFGPVRAVDAVDLKVGRGEMVSLLGPSGCGKTTTLRILGGFESPNSGSVWLRGVDVTGVPPHRRDTAMVFQSYALFPHLSVFGNVAYGLRRRALRRAEVRRRVQAMLDRLGLTDLADRRPNALSGGQRQRVAVGRALVTEPAVLLLDEPFSALDAQLREQTRVELRRLQQDTGTTAVFVTHDQQEALSISDRIVVLDAGKVEQQGTPAEVYEYPQTRFVAQFLGAANLLPATVTGRNCEDLQVRTDANLDLNVPPPAGDTPTAAGDRVTLVVRPEEVTVGPDQPHPGKVGFVSYLGTSAEVRVTLTDGTELTVRGPRSLADQPVGKPVRVGWRPSAVRVLPG